MTNIDVTDSSISNIMSPKLHKVAVLCDALIWHLHEWKYFWNHMQNNSSDREPK